MNVINTLFLSYASGMLKQLDISRHDPSAVQYETFRQLIAGGRETMFGHDYRFSEIKTIEDFQHRVPIKDYNHFHPYIEKLLNGEDYILWHEKTKYFAKSSGTSSDKSKFIPVSPTNLANCHYGGMKRMLANYVSLFPNSKIFTGKSLTLGGSVETDATGKIFTGDLSAILLKNTPSIVELLRVPKRETAMLFDFNKKIEQICLSCSKSNVTNFAGVPSWNLIMLKRILEYNNARYLTDVWPNVELFMHGGISFKPYIKQFDEIIPFGAVRYFENYNASEGYFAFQDEQDDTGMLLTLDTGVFFEFVPVKDLDNVLQSETPTPALTVGDINLYEPYAVIISTSAGLWRYSIGDVVMFTSTFPHKIIISGRTQLFINAFGEELMIGNAEEALAKACAEHHAIVTDYTVAPIFMSDNHKGSHQWVIEFSKKPVDINAFADTLDNAICSCNSDYEAKRTHTLTMDRLTVSPVPEGTFYKWMSHRGKVGGQNKVPRLSQDRTIVDNILQQATSLFSY
ncbi:MAG: GH3 auxin-responsive promoter family protein [Bacteroidales bacterium]|nr:GH3 auxin-responsive promoter family protein [Bacteroidales bacterium]